MEIDTNGPHDAIHARAKIEYALRNIGSKQWHFARDRLVKYYLTGVISTHLRTVSTSLINAALRASGDTALPQSVSGVLPDRIVEGFMLAAHPMAKTVNLLLASGARFQSRRPSMGERNSYAEIWMTLNDFDQVIGLDGYSSTPPGEMLERVTEALAVV